MWALSGRICPIVDAQQSARKYWQKYIKAKQLMKNIIIYHIYNICKTILFLRSLSCILFSPNFVKTRHLVQPVESSVGTWALPKFRDFYKSFSSQIVVFGIRRFLSINLLKGTVQRKLRWGHVQAFGSVDLGHGPGDEHSCHSLSHFLFICI